MKNVLEQFKENAQNIHLREDEKVSMRTFLENHTEAHPVRESGGDRLQVTKRMILSYQFLPLFIRNTTMPIILIMLLVSGGVSFAAQGSLPGDALYGVKVNFNERIEQTVAVSSEAKANVEVRLAERRLVEAEKLASQGELDAETEATIESRFEAHAARVEERIQKLSESEVLVALDVASRFEASLNAHESALLRINTNADARMAATSEIAPATMQLKAVAVSNTSSEVNVNEAVRVQADRMANVRANLEVKISGSASTDNKSSAEGKMNAAEKKIAEAKTFIESKTEAGTEARTEAMAELKIAENTFVEGKAKFEAKMYNEAFILFQKSLRLAETAKIRANVNLKINLDVKTNSVRAEVRSDSENKNEARSDVNASKANVKGDADVKVEVDGGVINIGL